MKIFYTLTIFLWVLTIPFIVGAINVDIKDDILNRTVKLTIQECTTNSWGTTSTGSTFIGVGTYLFADKNNSYWLTAQHVVSDNNTFKIEKCKATVILQGTYQISNTTPDPDDWAIISVKGYFPEHEKVNFNTQIRPETILYYENIFQYEELLSANITYVDENNCIYTDGFARYGLSGASVYNEEGELVAILTCKTKDDTAVLIPITENIIEKIANYLYNN